MLCYDGPPKSLWTNITYRTWYLSPQTVKRIGIFIDSMESWQHWSQQSWKGSWMQLANILLNKFCGWRMFLLASHQHGTLRLSIITCSQDKREHTAGHTNKLTYHIFPLGYNALANPSGTASYPVAVVFLEGSNCSPSKFCQGAQSGDKPFFTFFHSCDCSDCHLAADWTNPFEKLLVKFDHLPE